MNVETPRPVKEGNVVYMNQILAPTLEGRRAQMAAAKAINEQYHVNVAIGFPPSVMRAQRAAAKAAKAESAAPPTELPPVEAYSETELPPWVE